MTPLLFLLVGVAGGCGAVLRWLVEIGARRLVGDRFPWGVLIVNLLGSFALGVVTGALRGTDVAVVLGMGLLGGFTTFSSVATATALMIDSRATRVAVTNALANLSGCVALAVLGALLGRAL